MTPERISEDITFAHMMFDEEAQRMFITPDLTERQAMLLAGEYGGLVIGAENIWTDGDGNIGYQLSDE